MAATSRRFHFDDLPNTPPSFQLFGTDDDTWSRRRSSRYGIPRLRELLERLAPDFILLPNNRRRETPLTALKRMVSNCDPARITNDDQGVRALEEGSMVFDLNLLTPAALQHLNAGQPNNPPANPPPTNRPPANPHPANPPPANPPAPPPTVADVNAVTLVLNEVRYWKLWPHRQRFEGLHQDDQGNGPERDFFGRRFKSEIQSWRWTGGYIELRIDPQTLTIEHRLPGQLYPYYGNGPTLDQASINDTIYACCVVAGMLLDAGLTFADQIGAPRRGGEKSFLNAMHYPWASESALSRHRAIQGYKNETLRSINNGRRPEDPQFRIIRSITDLWRVCTRQIRQFDISYEMRTADICHCPDPRTAISLWEHAVPQPHRRRTSRATIAA